LNREPAKRYKNAGAIIAALKPFVSVPGDFPMRFFRPLHPSTVADGISKRRDSSSIPATLSIRKPMSRDGEDIGRPSAQLEGSDDTGPPTFRLSKALTDLAMDPLPEDAPHSEPQSDISPEHSSTEMRKTQSWKLLIGMGLLIFLGIIIIIALISISY
jgi:hypothetical protein